MGHVPKHGFSSKALALGAEQAGYLPVSVQLFPRGVFDLINYHLVTQRLALRDHVQFPGESKLGVGGKVRSLTLERLRANRPIIHKWQGVRSSLCCPTLS
jgi:ubiquinone biosynthesis protein COQ9